jgi:hypothetical protein
VPEAKTALTTNSKVSGIHLSWHKSGWVFDFYLESMITLWVTADVSLSGLFPKFNTA